MEFAVGNEFILTNHDGGTMAVKLEGFDRDGAVAVLRPTHPVMAAWFTSGYFLAQPNWSRMLTPLASDESARNPEGGN